MTRECWDCGAELVYVREWYGSEWECPVCDWGWDADDLIQESEDAWAENRMDSLREEDAA